MIEILYLAWNRLRFGLVLVTIMGVFVFFLGGRRQAMDRLEKERTAELKKDTVSGNDGKSANTLVLKDPSSNENEWEALLEFVSKNSARLEPNLKRLFG